MVVPGILAAQNWDDHDRSHRTMARDIGWNYLQSVLPNAIIINYGDNDTFPLWFNQEVDGVRPDVRIMINSKMGIQSGKRDELSQETLMELKSLETLVKMRIRKLIEKETPYKEIYQDVKMLVDEF